MMLYSTAVQAQPFPICVTLTHNNDVYQTSNFTFEYKVCLQSVVYSNGMSTWNYTYETISGKDISHVVFGEKSPCADMQNDFEAVNGCGETSFNGPNEKIEIVSNDASTVDGTKFDCGTDKDNEENDVPVVREVSFTLDGEYSVGFIDFGVKSGDGSSAFNNVPGPSCIAPQEVKLNLTAECRVGNTLYWRVTGDNDVDNVAFTWTGPNGSSGSGVVEANTNAYFTTPTASNTTTTINWFDPATLTNKSNTKSHNNWTCVYHIIPEKSWTTTPPSGLNGTTLLIAESSIATATCGYDANGVWKCTYTRKSGNPITAPSTPVDLEVPFGETYSVSEVPVNGWIPNAGVGNSFCRVDGFDASALPNALTYDLCANPYSTQTQGQTLAKFGTHTVVNQPVVGDCANAGMWLGMYNLIAFGDLNNMTESQGSVFVGGDLNLSSTFQIGSNLTVATFGNNGAKKSLEVAGGVIASGNVIRLLNYSAAFSTPVTYNSIDKKGTVKDKNGGTRTVEFNNNLNLSNVGIMQDLTLPAKAAQMEADLKAASQALKNATGNNTVTGDVNNKTFSANIKNANNIAVFNLTPAEVLSVLGASNINFNNPIGATTILINVPGTGISSTANISSPNANGDKIIWNFYEATTLSINGSIPGVVLAPYANVTVGTNVDGVLVAQNVFIGSESHTPFFSGNFSSLCSPTPGDLCVPDGTTYLINFDQDDQGNTLNAGTGIGTIGTLTQPYANLFGPGMGVTFQSDDQVNNPLTLYDSEGPIGNDNDLERNKEGDGMWEGGNLTNEILGNLLIINTDNNVSDPNDEANGGQILSMSTMDLVEFSFDIVDLEIIEIQGQPSDDYIRFENTVTNQIVDIYFDEFTDSNSPFYISGVAFGDRFANRITGITATKLGMTSFNKITFITDASFGIGAICIKKADEPGVIGNYVWLDENSDGLQDAGEPGIPNVKVDLKDANGNVIATTYTDSDGKYLFPNLPPATYFVEVDESTLPNPNMTQTVLFTNSGDNMPQNDNQDGDLGNKDQSQSNGYEVMLSAGEENLTADFGYNYNPSPDVNDPMNPPVEAALGDRVWIDTDGDGVQDANEIGVSGVEVTLKSAGPDGIAGNADDVTVTTKTTDANGYYWFDGLTPGAYVVEVSDDMNASHDILNVSNYDQTGDPDHFAEPIANASAGTAGDNKTTKPVVLGPGDVFLNADFGYQPTGAQLGSIGNTVWLDADADGNGPSGVNGDAFNGLGNQNDANEQPIAGVSVALILDLNGNGTWDVNEPIIATDVTDANGQYLFEGLPTGDDYIVWVNDTDNVLDGLKPTYDADAGSVSSASGAPTGVATNSRLGISAVMNLGTTPVTNQDFGFTPNAQDAGKGLIGDYVWFDTNRDGVQDATESGIEGVLVELYDLGTDEMIGGGDDMLLATTFTDENGYYYFGGLVVDAGGEGYQVKIATSNFIVGGILQDLENTFDPNGGNDNVGGAVSLTSASPINLMQDFGYVGDNANTLGSIGNLVWEDINANGVRDAGEPPIAGVTLDLYRDLNDDKLLNPGEPRIGTATTDANGNYLFDKLPLGNYIVDVTDEAGILNGYWHSLGNQSPAVDNNSKSDAFAVTIGGGNPNDNSNIDFGYYKDGASLGNYVWDDQSDDGLQNDGETGINNVVVNLTIEYPNGTTTILKTLTKNDAAGNPGFYEFPNLLLDEDHNMGTTGTPAIAGLPKFTISVDAEQAVLGGIGLTPTVTDVSGNTKDKEDSDDFAGVVASPIKGNNNTAAQDPETNEDVIASYDFGVKCDANNVSLTLAMTPTVISTVNQMVTVAFKATNTGTAPLSSVVFEANRRRLAGGPATAITGFTITESGTADNIMSPDEMWTFTAQFTVGTFLPGDVFVISGSLDAFGTGCGGRPVSIGAANLLFTVGVNMDVEIEDCFTPGQDLEVKLITRLLIDEDAATNPGTFVDDKGRTIQLPKQRYEARNTWLTVTGVNNGISFDPFNPPMGVNIQLYTDQSGIDAGRNTNKVLDELEPVNTVRQPCNIFGVDDPGCEFPDWVFKIKIPIPTNYVGNTFNVTATDQFQIFMATETTPGTNIFTDFVDITSISDSGGSDSEVAEICPLDYGDLPANYPQPRANVLEGTTAGIPIGTEAVWAGATVDTELSQQFSDFATGDDFNNLDDENGLSNLPNEITRGQLTQLTVLLNSNSTMTDIYYGIWFDWNGDGDFTDAEVDQFFNNTTAIRVSTAGMPTEAIVSYTPPFSAVSNYAIRLIVSNMPLNQGDFGSNFINGEIEDYVKLVSLPIELLDFTVTLNQAQQSVLKWRTASEKNNAYFSIQRSRDGITWQEIGQKKGAGNSQTVQHYDFIDPQPLPGNNYYRFQQFDFDGAFEYSPVRLVTLQDTKETAYLYPNPTTNLLNVQFSSNDTKEDRLMEIFNITGQQVKADVQSVGNGFIYTIDTTRLVPGTYILRIKDQSGTNVQILRFVRQ